eukprot:scaffold328_cov130-Cylindrotheca_fusiformis.AAC.3
MTLERDGEGKRYSDDPPPTKYLSCQLEESLDSTLALYPRQIESKTQQQRGIGKPNRRFLIFCLGHSGSYMMPGGKVEHHGTMTLK